MVGAVESFRNIPARRVDGTLEDSTSRRLPLHRSNRSMTRPVSPYRQWLGVAASHPTARQLLQLPEDVRDPAAIRAAAELARRKLQQIPASEADLRRKLEAAVAAAEQQLLGAPAKAEEDDPPSHPDLMAPFVPGMAGSAGPPTEVQDIDVRDEVAPPDVHPPVAPAAPAVRGAASRKARRRQQSQRAVRGTLVVAVVLTAIAVAGVWFAYNRGYLASTPQPTASTPAERSKQSVAPGQRPTKAKHGGPKAREPDPADGNTPETASSSTPALPASGKPDPEPVPSPGQTGSNQPAEMEEDPPGAKPEGESPKNPTPDISPEPKKSPKEKPAVSQFSARQWEQLRRHYRAARRALVDRRFDLAQQEIAAIRAMKPPPSVDGPLERLTLIEAYARQFYERLSQALAQLESGTELKVMTRNGERLCAVVEASPQLLVIRMEGRNRRLAVRELPPALALSIAHRVLDIKDPVTKVVDAAFLATRPGRTERETEMASQWWREARSRGIDIGMLEEFFGDEDRLKAE